MSPLHDNPTPARTGSADRRGGFMLIEAALTTVIVGVAVVALLAVIGTATRTNGDNRDLTRAIFLAQEVREMLAPLPAVDPDADARRFGPESGETTLSSLNDLDDFSTWRFAPPVNAQRQTLGSEWTGWEQQVEVRNVDPNYLAGHQTLPGGSTDMVRVTVRVKNGGRLIHQMSWIASAELEEAP